MPARSVCSISINTSCYGCCCSSTILSHLNKMTSPSHSCSTPLPSSSSHSPLSPHSVPLSRRKLRTHTSFPHAQRSTVAWLPICSYNIRLSLHLAFVNTPVGSSGRQPIYLLIPLFLPAWFKCLLVQRMNLLPLTPRSATSVTLSWSRDLSPCCYFWLPQPHASGSGLYSSSFSQSSLGSRATSPLSAAYLILLIVQSHF